MSKGDSAHGTPISSTEKLVQLCQAFKKAWSTETRPQIEDYVTKIIAHDERRQAIQTLVELEIYLRDSAGETPQIEEYVSRFPESAKVIDVAFGNLTAVHFGDETQAPAISGLNSMLESDASELTLDKSYEQRMPEKFGRFQVIRPLGKGAFGEVFLARDSILDRLVAIKVPRAENFTNTDQMEVFVQEAKIAAQLSHPGIVGIHDVGQDGKNVFIVQEFVDGENLAAYIKSNKLDFEQVAKLMIQVSEGVAHAHEHNLIHRDLKPGNILLDKDNVPRIADFGLAVHETTLRLREVEIAGSPRYMSPEQVRGENHRLDGRSDIWSLGVILYFLLTEKSPFVGGSTHVLFDTIKNQEPKPPHEHNREIPKELERICLKCLSKRISDRYKDAHLLADDLQRWLESESDSALSRSFSKPTVVPKGLRSFDEHDANFFLDLLPGPRDFDGLPESIRFWKTRIEDQDANNSFSVGLVYGPSGCGKSSLVKAGLIPRLSNNVLPVYLEASPVDTEERLEKGIRKHLPDAPADVTLPELVRGVREGFWIDPEQKILIVLDQFEQWLHTHSEDGETVLLNALRHCYGESIQCILLIRDDFWLATSRFMRALEINLVEGANQMLVDLFDPLHAKNVLIKLGRAFDRLPAETSEFTQDHERFLDRAIEGLTQNGKVICVHISLFADLIKGKPWSQETLDEVGGTEGLGQVYLEETFSSPNSPPENRYHLKAIQSVLSALLPEIGTDIKGSRQAAAKLCRLAGYSNREQDFEDVIRILDSKQRLITPTDSEDIEQGPANDAENSEGHSDQSGKYYQLTHDFLVPSLRKWLTQKQMESKSGRASLRLEERSVIWQSKPENRHLPALLEYLNIRLLTEKRDWTDPQQKMMKRAGQIHGLRAMVGAVALTIFIMIGFFIKFQLAKQSNLVQADNVFENLTQSDFEKLPDIIHQVNIFREVNPDSLYLDGRLQKEFTEAAMDSSNKLRYALALLPIGGQTLDYVYDRMLDCQIGQLEVIRNSLAPFHKQLDEKLWSDFRNGTLEGRFRAGLVLSSFATGDERWTDEDREFLVSNMMASNLLDQGFVRRLLTDFSDQLYDELESAFLNRQSVSEEIGAAIAISEFFGEDVTRIAELACRATPDQHEILFTRLENSGANQNVSERLVSFARNRPSSTFTQTQRVSFGKLRANAAINLMRLEDRKHFWEIFDVEEDPESMTQFIHHCRVLDVKASELVECLQIAKTERDSRSEGSFIASPEIAQFAMLLALGDFPVADIEKEQRAKLIPILLDWYANDTSARIHGATGWLLRTWGFTKETEEIDQREVPYTDSCEWFTRKVDFEVLDEEGKKTGETKSFYFTFIVIESGVYRNGAPDSEAEQQADETFQTVTLTKRIAVLDREIVREEFEALLPVNDIIDEWSPPTGDHPMIGTSWYEAIDFCRALSSSAGISEAEQCFADPAKLPVEDFPRETTEIFNSYPKDWPLRMDGTGFRLPTESEWEVFCRAGTKTAYSFGNDSQLVQRYGWVKKMTFSKDNVDSRKTQIPRMLRPNLYGLFDTHGNAWEWCYDWYNFGTIRAATAIDPTGPENGSTRILRGGSWYRSEGQGRSANRSSGLPTERFSDRGFRIVFNLPQPK